MASASSKAGRDFQQRATDLIVEMLVRGTSPWQPPFDKSQAQQLSMPRNAATDGTYTGGNARFLMAVALQKGYDDPRWMTCRKAQEKGRQVRRGEKAATVKFWQFDKLEAVKGPVTGREVEQHIALDRPLQRLHAVFNASQMDGIVPYREAQCVTWQKVEAAERALEQSEAQIKTTGAIAYYIPATDEIVLPPRSTFPDQAAFYGTALHELTHWTGHASRLNREGISGSHAFGSQAYAREEIRTEIASVFLQAQLGVKHDVQKHVSYVERWIAVLKKDKKEVFRAAKEAGEAADFVMGLTRHRGLYDGLSIRFEDLAIANVAARFGRLAETFVVTKEGPLMMAAAFQRELRHVARAELARSEDIVKFLDTYADVRLRLEDARKAAELEQALQKLDHLASLPPHTTFASISAVDQRAVTLTALDAIAYINNESGDLVVSCRSQEAAGLLVESGLASNAAVTGPRPPAPYLITFDDMDGKPVDRVRMICLVRTALLRADKISDKVAEVFDFFTFSGPSPRDAAASFAAIADEAHRHLGSNARVYPAQAAEGLYRRPIIAMSDQPVLQQVSMTTTVAHRKDAIAITPEVDRAKPVRIADDVGRASVAPLPPDRGPTKDRGLGR